MVIAPNCLRFHSCNTTGRPVQYLKVQHGDSVLKEAMAKKGVELACGMSDRSDRATIAPIQVPRRQTKIASV